jgi:ABC-type transport system involved in multi-copper enzyme maturation permease subunit
MNTVFAIAGVVIKEMYRRKDVYVLFILTVLITVLMSMVSYFKDDNVVRSLKEIVLLLIWVAALVIAVGTTARQIPAERENRTIFPLLAKPVTRAQVLLGKFTGCFIACGLVLVVFYLFFGLFSAFRENHSPLPIFYQGLWLQWSMLGIVIALVLLGSVVFAAPSSNATICLIVVVGILLLGSHLNTVAAQKGGLPGTLIYSIYFLIPHLEWYDVRRQVIYDHAGLSGLACLGATLYAAVYAALLLAAAWLVFRRKSLNR